ncbi:centrosomal protein of 295 kDa isoform X2 [Otolemur garnettii]|uniref:centrosomal protein of 295 kDa isoform X2 n=1 Tax=Otolemur garnettii TaxID=30611 RepID=UPI000C7F700D|nr:centrosomal protein of 295 kDa isoform X2 [Otolemur garnettii]
MKRKVVNAGKLRLSPNEEAFILKEDYDRRRKLRLLQVREQERDIALQIREDVKQRRNQQFTRLAEELRAEWEESQTQKIQNLEKLYLASLRSMGEGHQQAKENEPDLEALAWRTAERKRKADLRHKEALKVQKHQREVLMNQKSWRIKARKEALMVEKERSAKITSLPPPPPPLFENIEVKRISAVKTNSSTYHHLCTFVNREMDTKQPDAHLAAAEEAKRLEELQKQAAQERTQQFEKAHVRGFQAMKKIHLAQNQEKLMKELKQLQQEDLARRRQTVAQMPPQLVELPYRRSEMKEDWQRELEFAFEDMYNADRKVKGNLILHLEPEPLPTVTDQIQDEELNLSVEQENLDEAENLPVTEAERICSSETDVPLAMKTQEIPSKVLFKKLLNKIRSQKSLWTIKSMSEDETEMITNSETGSKASTVESGTIVSKERAPSSGQEQVVESDTLTIESGPLSSEDDKPLSCSPNSGKEQEINETSPVTAVAQSSVLLHPQEEATRIRMSARQKQIMEIEEQKQKQLELLEQIEEQKLRLETGCFRAHLEEEKRKTTQPTRVAVASASCTTVCDEDNHRQMIHNYQHQLLQQNRLHKQSIETARKRLLEYQAILRERYPSMSAPSLISDSTASVPPLKSKRHTAVSEHLDQAQRSKLSPNKYQPIQPAQMSKSEQEHFQVPRQNHFLQKQIETVETLRIPDDLAKQSLESQAHLGQFSQTETQQDYKLIRKDSHTLSRALSDDRPLILQDVTKIPETFRAPTLQTLDFQQIFLENSENASKLTEPSSFFPLIPQRSFGLLPIKVESGKSQEPLSTTSKSAVSTGHSVISQMHDRSLPSSENIAAQQGNLKALQEQLDQQKEVLQARQEAQEQLLLCKQKELEEQMGLSLFLPLVAPDSTALLPFAKAELGRIQESAPAKKDTAVSSEHPVVPQVQNRLLNLLEPILPQQSNLKFLQDQVNIERDNLQARREAQEVLCLHKQSELDRREWSEQAEPSSLPFLVAQHTFTSLSSADKKFGSVWEQYPSKSEKGLLSSQAEISKSQDGSSGFLQQFLPPHGSLKLLQEQLTTQRDTLQARHGTQAELLLHRQRDLGDTKSRQMSSFSPMVVQQSVASQASAKAEPRKIQKHYFSEENIIPSSHLITQTLQDKSFTFLHHTLPKQENLAAFPEQLHTERVILGVKEETRESVHKQSELEKRISYEQTGTSSSLSHVAESESFQEYTSIKKDSTVPVSHSKSPRFQERLLRFSQHILPVQGNLKEHQECLNTEKEAFQKTLENTCEQTVSSSFIPQLVQVSVTSLPSAESGTTLEPLSATENDRISSRHFQIPQLQGKLLRISQLIQPQQENLKALQEQLATQREAIIQSRREAQEELFLQKQSEWHGTVSPEQVSTFSLPLGVQHSVTSLPCTESENMQEPCSTNSDDTVSSGHSEIPRLPDRLLGLSHPVLLQENLIDPGEHLHAQTESPPPFEKTQKESFLPKPCKFEEKVFSEHLIQQPCHGELQTLQQQLATQRKAIQSRQEVQEELLLGRLSNLEERVSSEQISPSSFSPQVAVPIADSERTQKSFPTKNDNTTSSSHSEIARSQDGLLGFSQPLLPQQDNLTGQLDLQREVVYSYNKPQEELNTSESAEHAVPSLFLPKETEHSFIPLPFAETKSKSICDLYSSQNEHAALLGDPILPRFQDTLLSFSQPNLAQQDNVKLQKQLDLQKVVLHCSQRTQEELLVQRQTALQQQIQKHQETLQDLFKDSQTMKPTAESDLKTQMMGQLREWLPPVQDLFRDDQENISHADRSNSDGNQLVSEDTSAKPSGEHLDKELSTRSSKPPVAKVKCGLDLNQHELSAIQEVESPASGRTSILGKLDFYQDRDPTRVSISREQAFLGSPLGYNTFGCLQTHAQENVCGDDYDEPVKVKKSVENHAVLSHAVEKEGYTYPGPTIKPDNEAKTQEISHEPSSSVTVSTGSLLSNDNLDLSLTDAGSFAEHMDDREQESTTKKEEETSILNSLVPSIQVIYQWQNSSDNHKSLLPAVEEFTSGHVHSQQITDKYINEADLIPAKTDLRVDLDFPELEHIFPNLHRQLFKPLEPHPDFDLSSSSSVISQDNRDFYQSSESLQSHQATVSCKSTVSFTALRSTSLRSSFNTRLNQQIDTNLAHAAAQSFAPENIIEGSEQSYQQLLPEFSSQEGSEHADLPSIFSIEARDLFQSTENQNYSSEEHTEILLNKNKSIHFQLSVENTRSSVHSPSDEANLNVFGQLNTQHSAPCGSTAGEGSTKQQLESRKETLGLEGLPERGVTMLQSQELIDDKNKACGVLDVNPHVDKIDSPVCVTVEIGISNSALTETPKFLKNLSQLGQSELSGNSGSFSLQNSIPIWETESGHGIMEEPELTLVSTSDISIAETDFANLTLEEREREADSFQVSECLPPASKTDASDYPAVSELSMEKPTVSTESLLESLQEAFVKRKKSFMERSYQRQKEIWNKIYVNSQIKLVQEKPTIGSSVQRKGVTKDGASVSEDRKTLMQQRALRLHNQFAEVRQKEEKSKQAAAYTQNRTRAREFHKKTLEKLRAKNTC